MDKLWWAKFVNLQTKRPCFDFSIIPLFAYTQCGRMQVNVMVWRHSVFFVHQFHVVQWIFSNWPTDKYELNFINFPTTMIFCINFSFYCYNLLRQFSLLSSFELSHSLVPQRNVYNVMTHTVMYIWYARTYAYIRLYTNTVIATHRVSSSAYCIFQLLRYRKLKSAANKTLQYTIYFRSYWPMTYEPSAISSKRISLLSSTLNTFFSLSNYNRIIYRMLFSWMNQSVLTIENT